MPRERRDRVADPNLNVVAEQDNRDRQRQRQPELVAEHRHRMAGLSVVARTHGVVVVPARGVVCTAAHSVMGVVDRTRLDGCFFEVLAALLEVVVVFVMLDAHSGAFSSAPLPLTSFESGLLLNGAISKGLGLQAVVGDACAAFDRPSEGALLDPRFGAGHGRKLAL